MRLLYIVFCLLFSIVFDAVDLRASNPDTLWTRTIGGSDDEPVTPFGTSGSALASAITANGELYVVTPTKSSDKMVGYNKGGIDCWLVKLNASGDTLWTKVFGGEQHDVAKDVIALADGGCMVCGYSLSRTGDLTGHHVRDTTNDAEDGFIARFDSSGNMLWGKQYGGFDFLTIPGHDFLNGIVEISPNSFIAVGQTNSNNGDLTPDLTKFWCGWFVKIDGDGNLKKSVKMASPLHDEYNPDVFYGATLLSDESEIVAMGEVRYTFSAWTVWVVKTDTSGTQRWQREFGCLSDNASGGVVSLDSNAILLSALVYSTSGDVTDTVLGGTDIWLAKVDSGGSITDQRTIGSYGYERPYGLIKGKSGNFYCSGMSNSRLYDPPADSLGTDFFAVKLDANLNPLWFVKVGGTQVDIATDISVSDDESFFYLAGKTFSDDGYVHSNNGASDGWVGKFDSRTGIHETETADADITVFPVPAKNELFLSGTGLHEKISITIYDVSGKVVHRQNETVKKDRITVHLKSLMPGLYAVHISAKSFSKTLKFIKEE